MASSEAAKGSWSELFRDGRGLYSALIIGGIAMHATQMLVIAIIMPTVVHDIGGAPYYTWAAMLYTIGSIVGASSTGAVWSRFGARKGYALGASVLRARHDRLRARARHAEPDHGARRAGLGRRPRFRRRHGAHRQPLRRAAQDPHPRDLARHLHGLPSRRAGRRRRFRRDPLVARLVLADGALHARLRRDRAAEDPGAARHRGRAQRGPALPLLPARHAGKRRVLRRGDRHDPQFLLGQRLPGRSRSCWSPRPSASIAIPATSSSPRMRCPSACRSGSASGC